MTPLVFHVWGLEMRSYLKTILERLINSGLHAETGFARSIF
jgi:hypothetical protein